MNLTPDLCNDTLRHPGCRSATILWAGAHDTRFALVIASCSGQGGASLSNRDYGETVADMNKGFAYQFATNYQRYGSDPAHMPFDAHMLVALIAPRPRVALGRATAMPTFRPKLSSGSSNLSGGVESSGRLTS